MLLALLACAPDSSCEVGCGDGPVAGELTEGIEELGVLPDPPDATGEVVEEREPAELGFQLLRSPIMPTAVLASWVAPEGARSWIEVEGVDEPLGEGREELVLLVPQGASVTARVVAERDGLHQESIALTVTAGHFDTALETPVEVLDDDASVDEQLVLFTYEGQGERTVALITGEGELLYQLSDMQLGDTAPVSAEVALDGRGVLVGLWTPRAPTLSLADMETNAIQLFGWDGEPVVELPTPLGHHLFSQPEAGLVAWTQANPVHLTGDELPAAFDKLVVSELDGGDVVVFDSSVLGWDGECSVGGYYLDACDVHHANSMDCDLAAGTCLYSLHNTGQVLELSTDGTVLDDFSTWPVVDHLGQAQRGFLRPHDIHYAQDGMLLVFNDGSDEAWAARLEIDRQARTLTEVWSYGRSLCIQADALGTLQELDSGNHLVGFSTPNNLLREVTSDGRVVWELDLGGIGDDARCGLEGLSMVLGEARAVRPDALGPGVVALY